MSASNSSGTSGRSRRSGGGGSFGRHLALLKRIIKICEADIYPDFAFIEAIKQVQDDAIVSLLEASLDRALLGEAAAPVTLSVPVDLVPRLAETQTFNFKIGSVYRRGRPDLVMAEVISRCKVLNGVAPSQALREDRIELSDRRDGMGDIGGAPAIKWLEANGGTRAVPDGYRPQKVIFAIHLAGGRTVTDGTLFPFAQVALVNMATVLKSVYAVDVEVIGIPAE